ncbi:hypothetical protein RYH80_19880 [Halobaculum sp. MBLA0147]|uniref:hypothetical protein n=1 Tax=Halobaculum sp. MBLA0147 TaxID=3079934 RepID=UPI0035269CF9
MSQPWFTNPGSSGKVTIVWRDDGWLVKSSRIDSEVKCLLEGAEADPDESPVQLEGTVSGYKRGSGDMVDFLFLQPDGLGSTQRSGAQSSGSTSEQSYSSSRSSAKTTSSGSQSSSTSSDADSESQNQKWTLNEFSGSGDYVTVEAVVDSVHTVKKDTPRMPDIIGELVDASVSESVTFVVNDGVNHPYLKEGKRFEFSGVKDHYYTSDAEIQVMITEYTDFIEKERKDGGPSTSEHISYVSSTNMGGNSTDASNNNSNKSLRQIASDKIGEKEFTETERDQKSAVGKAKKKASDQQRDAAIDPRLQNNEDSEE